MMFRLDKKMDPPPPKTPPKTEKAPPPVPFPQEIKYAEPVWGGPAPFHIEIEVIRDGVVAETVDISGKSICRIGGFAVRRRCRPL